MSTTKVFVTTTPTLEGWEIEEYLGPVFSHIVAGTGFFSDFAASFSDIFGGRSQTYQRQLSAINSEAIELLKNKASLMGGNLILGFRIDHDEISGKTKQMFMVTASGTAARGIKKSTTKTTRQNNTFLTSDALEIALRKKDIIEKCQTIPISLTEEDWNFATENQVYEIAPQVLESLQQTLKQQTYQENEYLNRIRKYFLAIPATYSVSALYGCLHKNDLLFPFVRDTIFQSDLFDFDAIFTLFGSGEFRKQKWALDLVKANKPYYTYEDIGKFSKLIDTIKSTFVVRAQFIEEKSKLTSSVKHKWVCDCGTKNNKDEPRCSSCFRDVYGFSYDEPKPDEVIKFIERKVIVLQDSLR